MEKVNAVSADLKKGQFGYTIVTKTEPKMNKTGNPFLGRVEKISIYTNAMLGCNYSNIVNNRLKLEGKERNFVAQAPKGRKFYNAFFDQSEKDPETFYLKIAFYKERTHITTKYLIDGKLATAEQVAEIKQFLPKTYSSAASQGLEEKDEVKYIAVKFNNVAAIIQGEKLIFNNTDNSDCLAV